MKTVCVFCGSSVGARVEYCDAAAQMGREIAAQGLRLVYGGGNIGLMGVVAQAALDGGAEVIGVIPEMLMRKEVGFLDVTRLHVVGSMHERKAMMVELSDGFIALPGGFGTFEEFFEVVTWSQLGMHGKPCALLNIAGYYTPLVAMLDHGVESGLIKPKHRSLVLVGSDPIDVLAQMNGYSYAYSGKWLDSSRT